MARPPSHNVRIYERPPGSGRYVIRWSERGKQRQQGGFTDRIDAEQAALEKRRELRNPLSRPRASSTVGELLAEWFDNALPALKPGTREGYERHTRIILDLLPDLLAVEARSLSTSQVNRVFRALDLPDSTRRQMLNVLSGVYRHAIEDGLGGVETNPVHGAKRPSSERQPITIPTMDDVVRLAIAAPDDQMRGLLIVCAFAGLRQQEAFALRPVDVEDRHIHVRQAVSGQSGEIVSTKTSSGMRRVPMLPMVREAIDAAICEFPGVGPEDLIWRTKNGTVWNRSTFHANRWAGWREDAGVSIKWRHLRHFYVSQLAAINVSILQASRWAGHSKFSFTMDTYGFLFDEDEGPAMQRLEARITGNVETGQVGE